MKHSFKEWLAVTRYWSFPVSTMPVIVTFAWLFSRGEIPCEFKPYLVLILSLLGVIVFRKIRSVPLRYLCLTLCACFAISIYQGYVFLYYSILVVVMIEDCMRDNAQESRRARMVCSALSVAVTAAYFLCFQFISTIQFASAEEMFDALQARTDVEMSISALRYEYFLPLRDSYVLVDDTIHNQSGRLKVLFELFFLIPLLYMAACVLIRYERHGKGLRRFRNSFDLSLLTLLFVVPQFVLNVDWGRWMTAVLIDFTFILAYLLYCEDAQFSAMAEDLSERIRRNPLPAVAAVLSLNILPKLTITIFHIIDVNDVLDRLTHVFIR